MTNVVEYPQLNDPKVAEKVRKSLQDISNIMTMRAAQSDAIKEAINAVSEEHDVPKKLVRDMARIYHRQAFQSVVQEKDALEQAYEKVFGVDAD